jgi:selenocysteine lyase/cysteine desulfurase
VRKGLYERLEPPFLDLHAARWVAADRYEIRDDARRFENWETNFAGKVGLGVALDYALAWGLDAIWDRVHDLGERLRQALAAIPGVTVQDIGAIRCGIVTFTVNGVAPRALQQALGAQGINVTVSGVTSTRFDMEARGLTEIVRASVHYYNNQEEIEQFCATIETLARAPRQST